MTERKSFDLPSALGENYGDYIGCGANLLWRVTWGVLGAGAGAVVGLAAPIIPLVLFKDNPAAQEVIITLSWPVAVAGPIIGFLSGARRYW